MSAPTPPTHMVFERRRSPRTRARPSKQVRLSALSDIAVDVAHNSSAAGDITTIPVSQSQGRTSSSGLL